MPGKAGLVCFVNLIRKVQVATAGSKCFTGGKMGMFSESFSVKLKVIMRPEGASGIQAEKAENILHLYLGEWGRDWRLLCNIPCLFRGKSEVKCRWCERHGTMDLSKTKDV